MSKLKVTYAKVYADDCGKHTQDIFGDYAPEFISYKSLWNGVIDGFYTCTNSDLMVMGASGNMRIIVATRTQQRDYTYEQYFISGLDGKILMIPSGTIYAIENIDECKSSFFIGSNVTSLDVKFTSKNIFDWKRRKV